VEIINEVSQFVGAGKKSLCRTILVLLVYQCMR